jgi:hypothetical protein
MKIAGDDNLTRTQRIWKRKPHPERLPFFWDFPLYRENKNRVSCIHKARKIRNRWWKTLRHYNKALSRKAGMRWQQNCSEEKIDEYFNVRYYKADYTEFFD